MREQTRLSAILVSAARVTAFSTVCAAAKQSRARRRYSSVRLLERQEKEPLLAAALSYLASLGGRKRAFCSSVGSSRIPGLGLLVHDRFGDLSQRLVGRLFLAQRFLQ
jgi:hypothetical protein